MLTPLALTMSFKSIHQNKRGSSLCYDSFLHENHVYFDEYGLLSTISYQFKKNLIINEFHMRLLSFSSSFKYSLSDLLSWN